MLKRGIRATWGLGCVGVWRAFGEAGGFASLAALVASQFPNLRRRNELQSLHFVGRLLKPPAGPRPTFDSAAADAAAERFLAELQSNLTTLSMEQLAAALEVCRMLANAGTRPSSFPALSQLTGSDEFLAALEAAAVSSPADAASLDALLAVVRVAREQQADPRVVQAALAGLRRFPRDAATAKRLSDLGSFSGMGSNRAAAQAFDAFVGEWRETLTTLAQKEDALATEELGLALYGLLNLLRLRALEDGALAAQLISQLRQRVAELPEEGLLPLVQGLLGLAPAQVEPAASETLSALIREVLDRLLATADDSKLLRVFYCSLVYRNRIDDLERLAGLLTRVPLRPLALPDKSLVQFLRAAAPQVYQQVNEENDNLLENFYERVCEAAYSRVAAASQRAPRQGTGLDIAALLESLGLEAQKDVCAESFAFDYYLSNFADWVARAAEADANLAPVADFFQKNPDLKVVVEVGNKASFDPYNRRTNFYQRFRKQLYRRHGFFSLLIKDGTIGFLLRSDDSTNVLRETLMREAIQTTRQYDRRPRKASGRASPAEQSLE